MTTDTCTFKALLSNFIKATSQTPSHLKGIKVVPLVVLYHTSNKKRYQKVPFNTLHFWQCLLLYLITLGTYRFMQNNTNNHYLFLQIDQWKSHQYIIQLTLGHFPIFIYTIHDYVMFNTIFFLSLQDINFSFYSIGKDLIQCSQK